MTSSVVLLQLTPRSHSQTGRCVQQPDTARTPACCSWRRWLHNLGVESEGFVRDLGLLLYQAFSGLPPK